MAQNGKFITTDTGQLKEELAINVSAGAGDASKLFRTDAAGKIDTSFMPTGVGAPTKSILASEAIAAGDFVNVYTNAGVANMRKADATTDKPANGYVLAAVANAASGLVYFGAINNQRTGLIPGTLYFLATTPGSVAATAPTGAGNIVQAVGYALSATESAFEPQSRILLA